MSTIERKFIKDPPTSFDELDQRDRDCTKDDDQSAANPALLVVEAGLMTEDNFSEHPPYESYPAACALAYDLRRRGYDVEASLYDSGADGSKPGQEIMSWYGGLTERDITSVDLERAPDSKEKSKQVQRSLTYMPDGSYGHLILPSDEGHRILVWEKENGKVVLRDCYTNTTLTLDEAIHKDLSSVNLYRTDNKEITDDALNRVRNCKTK